MNARLAAYYALGAPGLAARYETVTFENVHGPILPFLPPPGARVADVGAGAGRDARALANLGYDVLAVEPSLEMRQQSRTASAARLKWCNDRLPALGRVRATGVRFDFVLCSAVLMHLDAVALPAAFRSLAALLVENGRLAVSLRSSRSGDPDGLYFDHSAATVLRHAAESGLDLLAEGSSGDALERLDVRWKWFVFVLSSA